MKRLKSWWRRRRLVRKIGLAAIEVERAGEADLDALIKGLLPDGDNGVAYRQVIAWKIKAKKAYFELMEQALSGEI